MPKVPKGHRQRAYRPKARSGCVTCKKRRVKCDETRPACLRCTSGGRTCVGYFYAQQAYSPPMSSESSVSSIVSPPPFDHHVHISPKSRRSFAFFMQKTSPQQAGFFTGYSDFWERLVFQAAYHDASIRHAIVAIGSLHELRERRTVITDLDKVFPLEQYNLAIRELLLPLSQTGKRGVDICLIACLLFTCFENMQGSHELAGAHIRSGGKLLRETVYDEATGLLRHQSMGAKNSRDCYVPIDVLSKIFSALGPESNKTAYDFEIYNRFFLDAVSDAPILTFDSVAEAKSVFEYGRGLFIASHSGQYPADSPDFDPDTMPNTRMFENLISKYLLSLQTFERSRSAYFTPREHVALAVLKVNVISSSISVFLEMPPPEKKARWQDFIPQFETMIELLEDIVSYTSTTSAEGPSIVFCLDMGIVSPLYTLGSQCRDPTIRRRAIALLRSSLRQEAIWNSYFVADAIESMMEHEVEVSGESDDIVDAGDQPIPPIVEPVLGIDGNGGWLRKIREEGSKPQMKFFGDPLPEEHHDVPTGML